MSATGCPTTEEELPPRYKRRYCRAPGCTRIVKSQGLCQRHGAKPKNCKVSGCPKQAQGNFDGMCKSHFKAHKRATAPLPPKPTTRSSLPPPPSGESVFDRIIPNSVARKPTAGSLLPLVQHLKDGFDSGKPPAWHRNEERRARGQWPVYNPATQLEDWERELVWTEILLLTGNTDASFRHLARAWGRDKGFHTVLSQFICTRRGDVERKKRERGGSATKNPEQHGVGADVWDDTCYGDTAYNEALAADLLDFSMIGRSSEMIPEERRDDESLDSSQSAANQEIALAPAEEGDATEKGLDNSDLPYAHGITEDGDIMPVPGYREQVLAGHIVPPNPPAVTEVPSNSASCPIEIAPRPDPPGNATSQSHYGATNQEVPDGDKFREEEEAMVMSQEIVDESLAMTS